VQVYYKLFSMSRPRLKLIRLFLKAMAGMDASKQIAKIERMLPGLNRSVDMGVVSVLSWYDRCAFEAAQALASVIDDPSCTEGLNFSKVVMAVGKLKGKGAAFLPHCTTLKPEREQGTNNRAQSLAGLNFRVSLAGAQCSRPTRGSIVEPVRKAVTDAPLPLPTAARERWRTAYRQVRHRLKQLKQGQLDTAHSQKRSPAEDLELAEFAAHVNVVAQEQLREATCAEQARSIGSSLQVRLFLASFTLSQKVRGENTIQQGHEHSQYYSNKRKMVHWCSKRRMAKEGGKQKYRSGAKY
jgi:hypothetical protein